jgi:hypothetical protein
MIPDVISRRPDFISEGPRNQTAIIAIIRGFNEDD